mgnify:CR=1 FL=1
MGIFSKLGRLSGDISSGFTTGIGSGLQSLSEEYEKERQLQQSQDVRRQSSSQSLLSRQLLDAGPAGRQAYQRQTGATGDIGPIATTEIGKFSVDTEGAITNSEAQFLVGPGERGLDVPVEGIGFETVSLALQRISKTESQMIQYLDSNKLHLDQDQLNEINNNIKQIGEAKTKLTSVYAAVIRRETPDPILQEQLARYGAFYNGLGYDAFADTLSSVEGSEDWKSGELQGQRLKVVINMVKQPGGPRKARAFINERGREDKAILLEWVDNYQAMTDLGITTDLAGKTAEAANSQVTIQHAYDLTARAEEGPAKVAQMRFLIEKSKVLLEGREQEYNQFLWDEASNLANEQNLITARAIQFEKRQGLAQDFIPQAVRERPQAASFDDPEIRRRAFKRAQNMFPDVVARRSYQARQLGNLTIPDIVAIGALQQMNVGLDATAAKQMIFNNDALNQGERIKAIQLFEEVGKQIGFDVITDDRNDTQTLTAIHQGFPAWWNQKTEIEDRVFDTINTKLTEQLTGQTKDGFLVNEGTPQNLAISIENARQSLEQKEMAGLLPVGAASRLTARLRDQYIGGDIGSVGPPSPFAEDEAVTSGEIAPSAPIEEAGDAGITDDAELKRQGEVVLDKINQAFFRSSPANLTEEEERILEQYQEKFGLTGKAARGAERWLKKAVRQAKAGKKTPGQLHWEGRGVGNKTTEATLGIQP